LKAVRRGLMMLICTSSKDRSISEGMLHGEGLLQVCLA